VIFSSQIVQDLTVLCTSSTAHSTAQSYSIGVVFLEEGRLTGWNVRDCGTF